MDASKDDLNQILFQVFDSENTLNYDQTQYAIFSKVWLAVNVTERSKK